MEETANKDFFELLETLLEQQFLDVANTDGNVYKFQVLNANQLKQLIQSLVDNSTNNLSFNKVLINIMQENFRKENTLKQVQEFNSIDKILFLLTARIQTISDKVYLAGDDDSDPIEVNLHDVIENLKVYVTKTGYEALEKFTVENNSIKVVAGIPNARLESQINDIIYRNIDVVNSEKASEFEEFIGNAFIAEVAKWIKLVVVGEKTLDFSSLSYEEKIKTIESLPAFLVEKTVQFIEQSKQDIQNCLTISNKVLPLNGSLFSVH